MEIVGYGFGFIAFFFAMYNLDEIGKLKEKVRKLEEGTKTTDP